MYVITSPGDITRRVLFDEKFTFTTMNAIKDIKFGPKI